MNIQSVTNCKILLTYSELKTLRDICSVVGTAKLDVQDDIKSYARSYADTIGSYLKRIDKEQFGEQIC